jgi:hypothetical protein
MDEEKLANPEAGMLMSVPRYELDEAQGLLLQVTLICIEKSPDAARRLTEREREQIKRAIFKTPLAELHRRLEAISVQNPGALAEALKRRGYSLRTTGDGGVGIDPSGGNGGSVAGRPITEAEFEKI